MSLPGALILTRTTAFDAYDCSSGPTTITPGIAAGKTVCSCTGAAAFQRKGQSIVQGRGEGFAVSANILLENLDGQITQLSQGK